VPGRGSAPRARVITIDGPAGAGKSTAAREVARRLGFVYLDSGAFYRAIAIAARRDALDPADLAGLAALRRRARLSASSDAGGFRVALDGADVTGELRAPEVGEYASRIATVPGVRDWVGDELRALAARGGCVAEGRDMGSRVFPDAALKVYLSASLEERARRRRAQLDEAGAAADEERVRAGIAGRDERDRTRAHSPLRIPAGAARIDNTHLDPAAQADLIVALYRGGGWRRGNFFFRAVQRIARAFYRLTVGLRVLGVEQLPHGGFIVASNHKSEADPPILGASAPGEIGFLAKAELFRIPLFGLALRALYAIPLRRGRFDRAAVTSAIRALQGGRPMVVFPEGTRIPGEALGRPLPGIGLIARHSGTPVVPTRILGLEHGFRLHGRCARVRFGAPLDPEPGETDAEFTERVWRAVARLSSDGG
jgi:CMP/dCMP kinase